MQFVLQVGSQGTTKLSSGGRDHGFSELVGSAAAVCYSGWLGLGEHFDAVLVFQTDVRSLLPNATSQPDALVTAPAIEEDLRPIILACDIDPLCPVAVEEGKCRWPFRAIGKRLSANGPIASTLSTFPVLITFGALSRAPNIAAVLTTTKTAYAASLSRRFCLSSRSIRCCRSITSFSFRYWKDRVSASAERAELSGSADCGFRIVVRDATAVPDPRPSAESAAATGSATVPAPQHRHPGGGPARRRPGRGRTKPPRTRNPAVAPPTAAAAGHGNASSVTRRRGCRHSPREGDRPVDRV